MVSRVTHLYDIKLYLNNALMQSPTDISKTQKSIDYIKHFGGICRFNMGQVESGVHHMNLILTNNNLSETTQWTIRLNRKLNHLNTYILSSGKDSDVKNIDSLASRLLRLKSPDELPDLIVMCTHEKRTSDVIKIIDILKNQRLNLKDIGIHKISLTIMFDEADKNMKLIVSLLKEIWPRLKMTDLMKDDIIRDIHFITATPLEDFWKALKKCGISKLSNINHAIQSMDNESVLNNNYAELMKNYRWLQDHTKDHSINDMTTDAVLYADKVMTKLGPHNPENPRIVFAPAELEKPTHYNMRDIFLVRGYWVFVDNSDKGKGKGFYNPRGRFQSIEDFRKEHNVVGEPYETFRKWKELHPTESLAITGWLTIIRGITFNTTGFNFTNHILSACHMINLANLLQVAGRANGDIKYVGKFIIHCPESLWKTLNERIMLMAELHEKNLAEFEEKDFRPKTKREEQEPAWTIPRVFNIGEERYKLIKKIGTSNVWDTSTIFSQIYDNDLRIELERRKSNGGQFQITQPDPDQSPDTYKKYITDFIQKSQENRKFNMGLHKDDKKKDGYQIFLDKRGCNIIVSIYNGTAISDDNN